MGIAAKQSAPRFRKPLPNLTPEYLLGLPTFTRNYFRELYSRVNPPVSPFTKGGIASSVPSFSKGGLGRIRKGSFAIVLDNYQDAPANSLLHEIIQTGLSEIPDGINVIIISRTQPPSAFTRLHASDNFAMLKWDDLKLTEEEGIGIARLRSSKEKLSRELLHTIHEQTQGWVAGLVLMLEQYKEIMIPKEISNQGTHEAVFNYFAGEIFQRTDKDTQEFLLKTAFLPKSTAEMARQLTGMRAEDIFSGLIKKNYFTIKHFLPEPAYEYHPLFRQFLEDKANKTLASEKLIQLKKDAARLLSENNEIEKAVLLLKQINEWGLLIPLILKHAKGLVEQGRSQTLEIWLRAIPEELHKEQPWLLYWLGACRLLTNPLKAHDCFKRSFDMFREQGNMDGIFMSWSGAVDALVYNYGDITPLDHWIAVAEELQIDYKAFISPEMEARITVTLFFCLAMRQPQHPNMNAAAERALLLTENIPDANLALLTRFHYIFYCLWIGDIGRAGLTLESLRPFLHETPPFLRISEKMFRAHFYWHTAQFDFCQKAVFEGLALARSSGVHVWDFSLLGNGITGALNAGDYGAAAEMLKQLAPAAKSPQLVDAGAYHFLMSWHALLQKDLATALIHAETSLNLVNALGWPLYEALGHLAMALVLHEMTEQERASEHLAKCMDISRKIRSRIMEWRCLLAEAQFALDHGNDEKGLNALRQAMAIGKKGGYLSHSYWQPLVMARLCAVALEHNIEADYVKSLIKKRELIPPEDARSFDNWPFPIKIYTLGRFTVLIDDKPLKFSGKTPKKTLELLKVIIASGGKNVSEDQITDILWPEADGDRAYSSLSTTLQRLRHLLGHEKAIQLKEGRLTLDPRYCYIDAWAFEEILRQAEHEEKAGKSEISLDMIEKALALYNGHFLGEDTDESWSVSVSERLRSRFIRSVRKFANHREKKEQWDKAVEYYLRGLEVDDLSEEFYQHLMLSYQELGRYSEALEVYNRCRRTLSSVHGIEPSHKTENIYSTIRQKIRIKGKDKNSNENRSVSS